MSLTAELISGNETKRKDHRKCTNPGVLERRLPQEQSYFLPFASNKTSQCGEDGILAHLFDLLPKGPAKKYCVDVGAWDGIHLSNTNTLINEQGWGGLLIEADSQRSQQSQQLYENRSDVICLNVHLGLVEPHSLPFILSQHNVAYDFDFLTIDIDGADYHIWRSLSHGTDISQQLFRPKVVCIEFNPTCPNTIYFIQPPDSRIHQGNSLLALTELGQSMGYELITTTTYNAIFLRSDFMIYLPEYDRSIQALHVPHMTTEIFQTYEGELMYVGVTKLLWHRLSINPQKLQVLKKSERSFPFAPKNSDGTTGSSSSNNSSGSGGIGGSNGSSNGGDENESPLLQLDRAVTDIQQQIEMIFCHEQQAPSSSASSSSSSSSSSLPTQQQETNKKTDKDKSLDDKDKSTERRIILVLKSLRRLTNLCQDLLPVQANEGLVLEALHSILHSADKSITLSLLSSSSSAAAAATITTTIPSTSADLLERGQSITDEMGRGGGTLSAPLLSLLELMISMHVECSQVLYFHAETVGKTNRDMAILCYKQSLHCLTPHLPPPHHHIIPSSYLMMHTYTYISAILRKLIHLTRKNEPFESQFWSFLLSIVNNLVKEQAAKPPVTAFEEMRINNPPVPTNSVQLESIQSSEELGVSTKNICEKNSTTSINGHATSSEEHVTIEMKRMDSWDLLALDVDTEHHHQLDTLQRKILELMKENDLLREEKERMKAATAAGATPVSNSLRRFFTIAMVTAVVTTTGLFFLKSKR